MKKKDSQFLPIAEQYLKYKSKRDFYNMHKLQYNYNICFKSIFDCAYMQIGDEQFLYDYNYKTQKYCIEEIRKIEGVRASSVKQIKEKMEEKLDVWNRREQIYMGKYKEQESERETIKKENSKDLNSLINLYNLVTQVDFQDKKANTIKEELVKGLNTNIEKYIKENNIQPPKNMKLKNKNKEAENEC